MTFGCSSKMIYFLKLHVMGLSTVNDLLNIETNTIAQPLSAYKRKKLNKTQKTQ